jgi:hypothetical protein
MRAGSVGAVVDVRGSLRPPLCPSSSALAQVSSAGFSWKAGEAEKDQRARSPRSLRSRSGPPAAGEQLARAVAGRRARRSRITRCPEACVDAGDDRTDRGREVSDQMRWAEQPATSDPTARCPRREHRSRVGDTGRDPLRSTVRKCRGRAQVVSHELLGGTPLASRPIQQDSTLHVAPRRVHASSRSNSRRRSVGPVYGAISSVR